jgi:hypothetical protein
MLAAYRVAIISADLVKKNAYRTPHNHPLLRQNRACYMRRNPSVVTYVQGNVGGDKYISQLGGLPYHWVKVPLLLEYMKSDLYDWVLLSDADTLIRDTTEPIQALLEKLVKAHPRVQVVLPREGDEPRCDFSSYAVLVRVSPFGIRFVERWWQERFVNGGWEDQGGLYRTVIKMARETRGEGPLPTAWGEAVSRTKGPLAIKLNTSRSFGLELGRMLGLAPSARCGGRLAEFSVGGGAFVFNAILFMQMKVWGPRAIQACRIGTRVPDSRTNSSQEGGMEPRNPSFPSSLNFYPTDLMERYQAAFLVHFPSKMRPPGCAQICQDGFASSPCAANATPIGLHALCQGSKMYH